LACVACADGPAADRIGRLGVPLTAIVSAYCAGLRL